MDPHNGAGRGSGAAALRLLSAEPPDVILLGRQLPERTEFDTLHEIRKLSDVPILMLMPDNDEAPQIESLDLGADDCIVLPVSQALLLGHIWAVMRRNAAARVKGDQAEFTAGSLAVWFQK